MWERNEYRPDFRYWAGLPDEEDLELKVTEDGLRVWPIPLASGMPRRHRRPPAVLLRPGEWLRWHINYRFGLDDGWFYRLDTWNVAYGTASETIFLGTPDRTVDERASLR